MSSGYGLTITGSSVTFDGVTIVSADSSAATTLLRIGDGSALWSEGCCYSCTIKDGFFRVPLGVGIDIDGAVCASIEHTNFDRTSALSY